MKQDESGVVSNKICSSGQFYSTVSGGEFHSVVVFVQCDGPGGPALLQSGYHLYGLVSNRLEVAEFYLGLQIHGSRALTVSPILAESSATIAAQVVPGRRYALRLTFLDDIGYAIWREHIWPSFGSEFKLGSRVFRPLGWTEDPREHPLAGRATIGDLVRLGEQHADDTLTLVFLTPVLFKSTYRIAGGPDSEREKPVDVEVLLPDPVRIINSLAGRWERFAPPSASLPPDLVEIARQTTGISRHALRTEAGRAKGDVRGFVGWAEFRCLAPIVEARAVFATLCRFAAFSGIGGKTAFGLGMVHLASKGG